jgi:hypothetical protein
VIGKGLLGRQEDPSVWFPASGVPAERRGRGNRLRVTLLTVAGSDQPGLAVSVAALARVWSSVEDISESPVLLLPPLGAVLRHRGTLRLLWRIMFR